MSAASDGASAPALHPLPLLVGVLLMIAGSLDPRLMMDAQGRVDHGAALALLWAMAAGLVRGVGFEPRARLWRVLLSAGACAIALVLLAALKIVAS